MKIPHTEKAELAELADIQYGYQSREKIIRDFASRQRIIQLRDVTDSVQWETVIPFRSERDVGPYLVHDGDVLLSCRGGPLVGVVLSQVPANTVASSNFYVLRIRRDDVLPGYLGWYLNQSAAQEFLRARLRGTRTAVITKADVAELEVSIPPLGTQELIAGVADLRRREHELVRRLESRKDLVIQMLCQNAIHRATHTEA